MFLTRKKSICLVVLGSLFATDLYAMEPDSKDIPMSSIAKLVVENEITKPEEASLIIQSSKQNQDSEETKKKPIISKEEKKERVFIKIIREISEKYEINIFTFTNDWNICLEKGNTRSFIHYYDFDINSAGSFKLCKDKTATAEILNFKGIPHIEHEMFLHPSLGEYLPPTGVWRSIHDFCSKYKYDVVLKPTNGSGGVDVYHTKNSIDLEKTVHELFMKKGDLSISPFYQIESEYRTIMLNGQPQLMYRKVVPHMIGDGESDLKTLFVKYLESMHHINSITSFLKGFDPKVLASNRVLAKSEKFPLKWKHNLEQGALVDLNIDNDIKTKVEKLAKLTASALNISFASVDIAEIGQEFKVMEVNSGVMMKFFMLQLGENGYNIAKSIYEKAICSSFNLDLIAD